MEDKIIEIVVQKEEAGTRLDVFLSKKIPGISRHRAAEICAKGDVFIEGRKARGGLPVAEGARITLPSQDLEAAGARPELAARSGGALNNLKIVFEDESVLVVDKPRGMPSVTLTREDPLTVADCLAEYCPDTADASPDPREAGLIQRLDRFTSGLMIAAKSREGWEQLRGAMSEREIAKNYTCAVQGIPKNEEEDIRFPLVLRKNSKNAEVLRDPRKLSGETFDAHTHVKTLAVMNKTDVAIVEVGADRARRHQIRAHLAAIGHPLVGDAQYGARMTLPDLQEVTGCVVPEEGFLLHASRLRFLHPVNHRKITLSQASPFIEKLLQEATPWRTLRGKQRS